jgi:hypothetical protein
MTRQQLEHIIRAAAGTADVRDIVVIGSQAILGSIRNRLQRTPGLNPELLALALARLERASMGGK